MGEKKIYVRHILNGKKMLEKVKSTIKKNSSCNKVNHPLNPEIGYNKLSYTYISSKIFCTISGNMIYFIPCWI